MLSLGNRGCGVTVARSNPECQVQNMRLNYHDKIYYFGMCGCAGFWLVDLIILNWQVFWIYSQVATIMALRWYTLLKPQPAQASASPSLNRCRLQICLAPICSLHKLVISGHISFFILLASCLMTFFVPPILVYVRGVADFTDLFLCRCFIKWKFK